METEERLLREAHADPEHQRLHGQECHVCWLLRRLDELGIRLDKARDVQG